MKRRDFVRVGALIGLIAMLGACFPETPLEDGAGVVVEGVWSGVLASSYTCEFGSESVELTFTGDTVAVTGGTIVDFGSITSGASGPYTRTGDTRFLVEFASGGTLAGTFITDSEAEHAVLIMDADPTDSNTQNGYIGVFQKAPLQPMNVTDDDLVGTWTGTGVSIDTTYNVTTSVPTSVTVERGSPGPDIPPSTSISGTYSDRTITASYSNSIVDNASRGTYVATGVLFSPEDSYDALYIMSYDQQFLAAAYLTDGCNQQIFDSTNIGDQLFALYERQ